jgi:NADH-quinone oxidoreductase subunit G
MPTITINGTECEFTPGEKIIAIANRCGVEIPQYCYHPGLSIPAQCRICLGEIWAPNPRNDNKLEPMMGGKLLPTCSTDASDGMVVYTDSPKSVANQKAVMEYLLINHPLDCPVCDQAGECSLQDFSYKYGRGTSRFQETKVKQPKKDLGPNIYIYSDRCILCTRCVRFAQEIPGTGELTIDGRGNKSQIDVFPGVPLDNELSGNVVDLCPVGALLDKDFLFAQRVWLLKSTPAIDPLTASGDNIWIDHNEGRVYRVRPRENTEVNNWWITDEVRHGWKFVHSDNRLTRPWRRQFGTLVESDFVKAYRQALDAIRESRDHGGRLALLVSPMLTCEEAFSLAMLARELDPDAVLAVGPVPFEGEDRVYPRGVSEDDPRAFKVYAEKAPNARGVRRALEAVANMGSPSSVPGYDDFVNRALRAEFSSVIVTGSYPTPWVTDTLLDALSDPYVVMIDSHAGRLSDVADVVLPGATFAEKGGTFENARGRLQAFHAAVPVVQSAKTEGQIAEDLRELARGGELDRPAYTVNDFIIDEGPGQVPAGDGGVTLPRARAFDAATIREEMARASEALRLFTTDVRVPPAPKQREPDMQVVEL